MPAFQFIPFIALKLYSLKPIYIKLHESVSVHPILFGLRRERARQVESRPPICGLQMLPRKLALAWLRQLVAIRAAVARQNGMGCRPLLDQEKFLPGLD